MDMRDSQTMSPKVSALSSSKRAPITNYLLAEDEDDWGSLKALLAEDRRRERLGLPEMTTSERLEFLWKLNEMQ